MITLSTMTEWMFCCLLIASSILATPKLILTGGVTLIGTSLGSGQEAFYGIPYAEPPIGALRLEPPVPKAFSASSVIHATAFGPGCLQPVVDSSTNIGKLSEDCLTINVQRPAGVPAGTKLPVMAWIYGGAFLMGRSSDPTFNATNIINQSVSRGTPVIYVNFNYRLGPLGFPVGEEAERHGILNLGLKDQLLALEWIQNNIRYFGGDKSKVTLYGESAGAFSVGIHMVNPRFKTLARAAILESGVGSAQLPCSVHCDRTTAAWNQFVRAIPECKDLVHDSMTCIRTRASQDSIAKAVVAVTSLDNYVFFPIVDGPHGLLPDDPLHLISAGKFVRVPVISGNTLDEGTLFSNPAINATQDIVATVKGMYPPSPALNRAVDRLLKLYPDVPALGSPYNTGNETFGLSSQYKRMSAILGDILFIARQRHMNTMLSEAGVDVFGYRFSDPQTSEPPFLGVSHSFELDYVYGNPNSNTTSSAKYLSAQMVDYWLSFATSLTPNDCRGSSRPTWPTYGNRSSVRQPSNQFPLVSDAVSHKILDLHGRTTKPIPDNFRDTQITFIQAHFDLFRV